MPEAGVDVCEQSPISRIFLSFRRDVLEGIEGIWTVMLSKVRISKVVPCIVGFRIGIERSLEMAYGFSVKMIAGKQNPDAHSGPKIALAQLIEPGNRLPGIVNLSQLQVT